MLYITRGVSCSGKDTMVNATIDAGHIKPYDVLSSDMFRGYLSGNIGNMSVSGDAFNMIEKILASRLEWKAENTVWNTTALLPKYALKAIDICRIFDHPYTVLELVPPSFEELKERNIVRHINTGVWIPTDVLEKQYEDFYRLRKEFYTIQEKDDLFVEYREIPQYCTFSSFLL